MIDRSSARFRFELSHLPPEAFDYHAFMAAGLTKAQAKQEVQRSKETTVYLSDTYQVNMLPVESGWGITMTWLSVKRRDKEAFHDWREMQQIKNAILGADVEAVELYPAEARLVDTSNQYHLWALPKGMQFPFGYRERLVLTSDLVGPAGTKSKQRPFAETA